MKVRTRVRQDPLSTESYSAVDLVRRRDPPPYTRTAKSIIWTNLGGIVWVFIWVRVVHLLFVYGISAGFIFQSLTGIHYDLPQYKLSSSDLLRLVGGQAVMDSNGRTVVDPTTDCVRIFSIQTSGDLEQKFQSTHSGPCERTLVVLLPSKAADLQVVVTAMDLIRSDRMENVSPDAELWIADPDLTAGSSE